MNTKKKSLVLLVVLYALTWSGGWFTFVRDTKELSDQDYSAYVKWQQNTNEYRHARGLGPDEINYREKGPHPWVKWCAPVFPGVLIAQWGIYDGTWESGATSVVVYWGFGTKKVLNFSAWHSDCI